ncbi:MAG: ribulokinase, partial [Flavitalea sp.]
MKKNNFVIGVDYGTDSVRSVILDAGNGTEIAHSVFYYPRWKKGLYCDAGTNRFRQHPLDYLEGLEYTIKEAISKAGEGTAENIRAISIDTTGSSPVAVNNQGVPLALLPGMQENPDAMFYLWKDHTSIKEAAEINEHATKFDTNYLRFVGGIYSSEWFWAKLLHALRSNKEVRNSIFSWVEHCDWIPFVLTCGNDVMKMKRSRCAAGHKALWAEAFGGPPPNEFFNSLDPLLDGFTGRMFTETYTSDEAAGNLSK